MGLIQITNTFLNFLTVIILLWVLASDVKRRRRNRILIDALAEQVERITKRLDAMDPPRNSEERSEFA